MINTLLLEQFIENSGKKKVYLASRIGITPQSFRRKVKGLSDFTVREATIISKELSLSTKERESIFLVKM